MTANKFWSPLVATLSPYVPGEQPRHASANLTTGQTNPQTTQPTFVKLNTNENPFGPSPRVLQAIKEATNDDLRLYPDPESVVLKEALARRYRVGVDEVFVGNGSDEVLGLTFAALLKHELPLLFPDISYSFYPVYCALFGTDYQRVPLTETLTVNPADYLRPNGGIIITNPNAPTGTALRVSAIETILTGNPDSVVVVDEAYVDFGGESVVPLIPSYPNLLVTHSFSKSRSLAGLRVGYALGQKHLIDALRRVKDSFNSYPLDRLAVAGAVAAIDDEAYFQKTCAAVISNRQWLVDELIASGFSVLPSSANFVFATHPQRDAKQLQAALRSQGVLVRYFDKPRIDQYLRITVGSRDDCQLLMNAIRRSSTA
jgi:histidinol-phosphate aminotransferase